MRGFLVLVVAAHCSLAAAQQYDSPVPQRLSAIPGAVPLGGPPPGSSPTRVLRQRVPAARFLQAQQEAAAAAAAGGIPQGTPVRVRRPGGGVRGGRVPTLAPRPVIEEAEPVIQTAPPPPPTQPSPPPPQFATSPPQSLSQQYQQQLQQQLDRQEEQQRQQQQTQQEQQQLQSLQAPSISEIQLADDGHLVGSQSPSPSPSPTTPARPLFLQPSVFRPTRPSPSRSTSQPLSPEGFLPTSASYTENTRGYLPTSSATPQPSSQPQVQTLSQSVRRRPAVPFRPERPVPVVTSTPTPFHFQQLVNEDEDIVTHTRRGPTHQRTQTRPTAASVEPTVATSRPRPRPIEQRPRPQGKPQRERRPVAQILRRYREDNPDGSITWGYENDDGSFKEETIGIDCMVRGKYGYVDPDGNRREYTYQSGIPCAATEAPISDSAVAAAEGYIDYQNNQLVLPSGQAISLDKMVKNRKRKPVAKIRN